MCRLRAESSFLIFPTYLGGWKKTLLAGYGAETSSLDLWNVTCVLDPPFFLLLCNCIFMLFFCLFVMLRQQVLVKFDQNKKWLVFFLQVIHVSHQGWTLNFESTRHLGE